MSELLILGVESSCDETGAGTVRDDQLLADEVVNSVDLHARLGGVAPKIASRAHLSTFVLTLQRAVAVTDVDLTEVDAIAVTAGPSPMGALPAGISAAKALAAHLGKPLYGVNHLVRHIAIDLLDYGPLPMPTLVLLVPGGHTSLLYVRSLARDIEELGSTIDDAAGEAYDKVARPLDLPYPGGPAIDRAVADGDPATIRLPRGLTTRHDLEKHRSDFSFSDLRMAAARWAEIARLEGREVPVGDVCASFQEAATDALVAKTLDAARQVGMGMTLLGGRAAASLRLCGLLEERATAEGVAMRRPRPGLCTNNGATIATVGLMTVRVGLLPSSLDFSALTGLLVNRIVV